MERGLICGIVTFLYDDHYRSLNATWARDICTFSGCLVGKTRENNEVRYNMTQIASLITVATVFYWLMDSILQLGRGRGTCIRDKLPMQEFKLKMQGEGIIVGIYGTCVIIH